jgi:hypothetical protein
LNTKKKKNCDIFSFLLFRNFLSYFFSKIYYYSYILQSVFLLFYDNKIIIVAVNASSSDLWPGMMYVRTIVGHYVSTEMEKRVLNFNAYWPSWNYDIVENTTTAVVDQNYIVAVQIDVANRTLIFSVGGQSRSWRVPSDAILPPPLQFMWLYLGRLGSTNTYSDVNFFSQCFGCWRGGCCSCSKTNCFVNKQTGER